MKAATGRSDEAVLQDLGRRLTAVRLARNLTQAALAQEAGVSKRTVERLESGEVASRLSAFARVLRVLGLLERFEALVPEQPVSPVSQLKLEGRRRKRASGRRVKAPATRAWTWGDES